jgi:hypothetical protein
MKFFWYLLVYISLMDKSQALIHKRTEYFLDIEFSKKQFQL